jgi:hypothetical protein
MTPKQIAAIKGMLSYFDSGNNIPVDKAVIKGNCAEVAALRAALAESAPVQEPVHKLVYPGGGKALFNRLWHLTCNAVATQSGMRVRTDVMPMREMKEFLDHLCVLVDSPPQPVPAPVQEPAKKLWLPHGVFPDVADFDADGLPRFYSKESVTKFQGGQCSKPCTGKNCGSMNGWMHSIECRAEHEAVNTAPVQETSTCGRCVVFCQGGDGCLSGMSQITQLGYLTGIN